MSFTSNGMKSIRGSLGSAPKSNFFSFQDIIMSVTGILIVIALMLALQIDKLSAPPHENLVSDDAEPASASPVTLSDLENAILARKTILEELHITSSMTDSETEIRLETSRLEEQIARRAGNNDRSAGNISQYPQIEPNIDKIKSQAAEIIRLRHEIQACVDKLTALSPNTVEENRTLVALEQKVRNAEAAVTQARLDKKKLKLIRELSDTTKEPIIVDVSGKQMQVMRFDIPTPEVIQTVRDFQLYIKKYSKEEQYFVLYFRPSGSSLFEQLRQAVKTPGFEIGYDAIEENSDLSLGKTSKQ